MFYFEILSKRIKAHYTFYFLCIEEMLLKEKANVAPANTRDIFILKTKPKKAA